MPHLESSDAQRPRDHGTGKHAGEGVEPSFDADPEVIFETVLPLRAEEMTASQRALGERLLKARAARSRPHQWRARLLNGIGTLVTAALVLSVVAAFGRTGRSMVCATACVVIPVMLYVVSLLMERLVWRPLRWTLQPWSCPSCGYGLDGLLDRGDLRCPECGAACDVEGRRHLVLDTAALLAEVRQAGGNLAWAVKANPGLGDLAAKECADLLERAELAVRGPLQARLAAAAVVALGLLLLAGGMLAAGAGILTGSWLGALGALPTAAGIIILLRSPHGRRQRLAMAIAEALPEELAKARLN